MHGSAQKHMESRTHVRRAKQCQLPLPHRLLVDCFRYVQLGDRVKLASSIDVALFSVNNIFSQLSTAVLRCTPSMTTVLLVAMRNSAVPS